MTHRVNKVVVIGLGLIGGSLAKALKQQQFAKQVAAFDRNTDELQQGLDLGVIDVACESMAQALDQADLVVLAVPVKATEAVLRDMYPLSALKRRDYRCRQYQG